MIAQFSTYVETENIFYQIIYSIHIFVSYDGILILLFLIFYMNSYFRWVHTVMQIKDSSEESQVPVIICTNQILRLVSDRG